MIRYADPSVCVDCRAPIDPGDTRCADCGLDLTAPLTLELFRTLQHADHLLERLRTPEPESTPARAREPEAAPDAGPVPPVVEPPARPRRQWTVPTVLLTLGGLCLAVAALVFLAVAWGLLGVGGRTAVLLAVTAAAGVGTVLSARRGLLVAAETLGALTGLFAALDLAGAVAAGWFGDPSVPMAMLAGGLVLAAAGFGFALALGAGTGRLLYAPQVWAAIAADLAALGALIEFGRPAATFTVVVFASGITGGLAFWTGQRVLGVDLAGLAGLGWLGLAALGLVRTLENLPDVVLTDVLPLAIAAVLAGAVVPASPLPRPLRIVAGVVAVWMAALAASAWSLATVNHSAVVIVAVVVAAAGVAVGARGIGLEVCRMVALTGTAGLILVAGLWLAVLAVSIGSGVEDALSAAAPDDWLRRFDRIGDSDPDLPRPWTVPLAAAGAAGSWFARRRRLARVPVATYAAGAVAVGAPVVLGYVDLLVVAAGLALVVAGAEVVAATQSVRRASHWLAAGVAWVVAAVIATYHPGPGLAVTGCAAVVASLVIRLGSATERLTAAAVAPPLTAGAVGYLGGILDVSGHRTAAAAIGAVLLLALSARLLGWAREAVSQTASRAVLYVATLLTAGVATAGAETSGWLAAYLSLTAAGAAVAGIADRSRPVGAVASALGLAALWVRLDDTGVETAEAYTLPLAATVLAFGAWVLWRDSSARTAPTLGPGLSLALAPSLVLAVAEPITLRALLVAAACLALFALGAALRWHAPLVIGALAGAVLVAAELFPYHDAVPRWVLLSAIGVGLLAAGIRWEALASAGRRAWGAASEFR
ncbi:MAG: hypothetical protein GEU93_11915 [Propionibacteriales bacterium]|nr:hypothetical protein [Propionibacteriales bacterium]